MKVAEWDSILFKLLQFLNRSEEYTITIELFTLEFLRVHQNQMIQLSAIPIVQMWNLFLSAAPQRMCIPGAEVINHLQSGVDFTQGDLGLLMLKEM